ncbi:MAG: hypothetical protein ACE5FG_00830 [Myxococcota bacterium]
MLDSLTIAGSALLAGAVHVLLGADHLAAVAPFALDARRRAWAVGLRWGVGHAVGIVTVAVVAYALMARLEIHALRAWSPWLVGGVLIAIGLWGLRHARSAELALSAPAQAPAGPAHVHTGAAFLVGALHGIAGTGNLLGVLPAIAQPSWPLVLSSLTGFALGTILAMGGFAWLLSVGVARGAQRVERLYRSVFLWASRLCLGLGSVWMLLGVRAWGLR